MKKRKLTILLFMLFLLLTGCGSKGNNQYTSMAVEQIKGLEYDAALENLVLAEEAGEDPAGISRIRGIALLNMAEYEEALNNFLTALSFGDGFVKEMDYDLNFYIADCYERLGRIEDAVGVYSSIIDLDKKNVEALFKRGSSYLLLGNADLSVADFNRVIALEPDDYDLRIGIAGKLFENNMEVDAKRYLNDFLIEKDNKLSQFDKGRVYFYMRDYDSAKQYLEEARDENDANTILYLGKTYEYLGDYNYAASTYTNYLDKHPDSPAIYNQLGLSKLKSKEYAEARQAFSQGLAIEDNDMEQVLMFNEIVAYERLGDFNQARIKLQDYLKKYPDDPEAVRENEFLKSR